MATEEITRVSGEFWELVKHDAIVKLDFLSTAQGGRKRHTHSGYRPDMMLREDLYETIPFQTNVGLYFIDKCFVYPNDTVYAELKTVCNYPKVKGWVSEWKLNQEFFLLEGRKIIAHGEIVKLPE